MALRHNPKIVTNGLVLCLDAGNPLSYSGSGTVWNDLSGNGNNGTLTNGPTFSFANAGSIVFDGTNDYANLGKPSSLDFGTGSLSISIWIKPIIGNILKLIMSKGATFGRGSSGWWFALDNRYNNNTEGVTFHVNSSSINTSSGAKGTINKYTINQWNNIVAVWDSSTKDIYIYINNILSQTTLVQTGGSSLAGVTDTNNANFNTIIAAYNNGDLYNLNANMALISIYNRILTSTEISQNYNATKGRYAL